MEVLEALLCAIANVPNRKRNYILRGSMLYRQRIDRNRTVKDMDIFIRASYFDDHNFRNVENLLTEVKDIIHLTNNGRSECSGVIELVDTFSGYFDATFVIVVNLKCVQNDGKILLTSFDVGRDCDEIPIEPFIYSTVKGEQIEISVSPIFVSIAWKTQILFRGCWRAKDVYDLSYLIANHVRNINMTYFCKTFKSIMEYRKISLQNLELVRNRKFGQSKSAKRKWRKWQERNGMHSVNMEDTWKCVFDWMDTWIEHVYTRY